MARESRPPGFDMTYRPRGRQAFGPPFAVWVLPCIYLVAAVALTGIVMAAHTQSSGGWLFRYIVEGDQHRVLGARVLAGIFLLGAIAAMIRTGMRGVVVHPDGVEFRDVIHIAWPKIKNCSWAEIDEVVFESKEVGLRLWDGDRQWLPSVNDPDSLRRTLERVAVARGIPLKGEGLRPVEEVEAELDEMVGGLQ